MLVSKLKPHTDILALHQSDNNAFLHFGENYAQELAQKAALLPSGIRWHMIGGLQSNKCKPLASDVPGLWLVSSVDTAKKADGLDKGRAAARERLQSEGKELEPLRVHVQVNTSGEESKSGVAPGEDTVALCRHVRDNCPNLQLVGLMTIGAIARSKAMGPETQNEDFEALSRERDGIVEKLGLQSGEMELSMGMSDDFEGAVRMGSDEVRVGSTIFGARPPKNEATI